MASNMTSILALCNSATTQSTLRALERQRALTLSYPTLRPRLRQRQRATTRTPGQRGVSPSRSRSPVRRALGPYFVEKSRPDNLDSGDDRLAADIRLAMETGQTTGT